MENIGDFGLGPTYWSPYLLALRAAVSGMTQALTAGMGLNEDMVGRIRTRTYTKLLESLDLRLTVVAQPDLFVQTTSGYRPRLDTIRSVITDFMK